jgi:hypothetical protein
MRNRVRLPAPPSLLATVVAALLLPGALRAQTLVTQTLASTGEDPDGVATVVWKQEVAATTLTVTLDSMPEGGFNFFVAGSPKGGIPVGPLGTGELQFVTPADGTHPLFDFDVFGQQMAIIQGTTVFFADTFSQPTGPVPTVLETVEIFLVPVGAVPNAKGTVHFEDLGDSALLELDASGLGAGSFDVTVGDTVVGQIPGTDTPGETSTLLFEDPAVAGSLPLDFDPLGTTILIGPAEAPLLAGVVPASKAVSEVPAPASGKDSATNLGKKKADSLRMDLANLGVLIGATGTATLTQSADLDTFTVDVQGMPAGASFDVVVDGEVKGALVPNNKGKATLVFEDPQGTGSLFDFPVKARKIEVLSGTTPALATFFPVSTAAALGKFKKEKHGAKNVGVNLLNVGVDLDARGFLSWELNKNGREILKVGVQDLDAGSYDVLVDGVVIGEAALQIAKDGGSDKVTFDSNADGTGKKLPLDIPVHGTTVSITPDADNALILLQADVE